MTAGARLKGSYPFILILAMEVSSTPGPSTPPSPTTSTSTEPQALLKTESPYVSNHNGAAPVTPPRRISGWRAYLMIGAISGSTFLNVRHSL